VDKGDCRCKRAHRDNIVGFDGGFDYNGGGTLFGGDCTDGASEAGTSTQAVTAGGAKEDGLMETADRGDQSCIGEGTEAALRRRASTTAPTAP
jgi:hypothetical protein